MMLVLKKAFVIKEEITEKKFSDMTSLVLTLLYNVNSEYVLNCFKSHNVLEDKILILDKNGTEKIWGNTYKMIKKNEQLDE